MWTVTHPFDGLPANFADLCRAQPHIVSLGAAYVLGEEAEGDGASGQALEGGAALQGLD